MPDIDDIVEAMMLGFVVLITIAAAPIWVPGWLLYQAYRAASFLFDYVRS